MFMCLVFERGMIPRVYRQRTKPSAAHGQLIQMDVRTDDNPAGVCCKFRVWLWQPNRRFQQTGAGVE